MSEGGTQDQRVLIIGAGITGLLVAQGCKKNGIPYTLCEREPSANHYRLREWGLSFHWAIPHFEKCVPEELAKAVQECQANPHQTPPQKGEISFYDTGKGEEITRIPFPFLRRMSRNKFRNFLTKDLDIQYGKSLKNVAFEGDDKVTAHFEDGTSFTGTTLVGCDGPRSKVREAIFGQEEGTARPMGILLSNIVVHYNDAEKSKWVENSFNGPMVIGVHPNGFYSYIAAVDIADADDATTWKFQVLNSRLKQDSDQPSSLEELKERGKQLCDPFKTAIEWIPDGTAYFENELTEFEPREFDQKGGRITLVGDAAHPMAPHRGQGLNHGVCDAGNYVDAVKAVKEGEKSLADAINDYTAEMVSRGKDEVRLSRDNAYMQHDLEKVLESPFVKHNVGQKGHGTS